MNQQTRIVAERSDSKARFSANEFLHMADTGAFDDMKVELIGGELYRMNPPMSEHGRLQSDLIFLLKTLLHERTDLAILGEVGIVLSDETVVGADVAVARLDKGENRRLRPDDLILVVEVAITSMAKDSGVKRFAYAEANIPEYWIVDGKRRVVHFHSEPREGDYASVRSARFGEPFTVFSMSDTVTIA